MRSDSTHRLLWFSPRIVLAGAGFLALAACDSVERAEIAADRAQPEPPSVADTSAPGGATQPAGAASPTANAGPPPHPGWASGVVWYQIFPERFRNGDPTNDPPRESIDSAKWVPPGWRVTSWTMDWYAPDFWETQKSKVFYDLVTSRRYGGDLQGVLDKLDYLRDLGVGAIYFNPVFWAGSMHKYDGTSFHHIDPWFGPDPAGDVALIATENPLDTTTWKWTAADRLFLKVVAGAHRRGMRVVIDGVFNHSGQPFFAFQDVKKNGAASPYAGWYVIKAFDDPATPEDEFQFAGWWGFSSLPEFKDTDDKRNLNEGVKAYVFDITRRWMDPNGDGDPSDGIDGWRLDVADEVPVGFWAEWNALVRSINPGANTYAEIWADARALVHEGGFTGAMNYHGFAIPLKAWFADVAVSATDFLRVMGERWAALHEGSRHVMMNLVDSHDTQRVASMIVNRREGGYQGFDATDFDSSNRVSPRESADYLIRRPDATDLRLLRMVVLFQMTFPGAPVIYYGTEAGMWGGDDPDNRMPMVWEDLKHEPQAKDPRNRTRKADPVEFDRALHDYVAAAARLRKINAPLREGGFSGIGSHDDHRVIAFARESGDERLVILFNRSEKAQSFTFALRVGETDPKIVFASDANPGQGTLAHTATDTTVTVPPLAGVVVQMR